MELKSNKNAPASLLDQVSLFVGKNLGFQLIEERFNRIPEPVIKKVIYHSFPRSEEDIYMYSSFTNSNSNDSSSKCLLPFYKGISIVEHGGLVGNVLQIGFHLSGTVESLPSSENKDCGGSSSSNNTNTKYRVSLSFDRCKITSCSCSCESNSREIFWCEHIVALSIYRIRFAPNINLRVPISEQLLQLNRDQLQKLVQYIISDHTDVLPTAQNLTDEILNATSEINTLQGAPDPTAGPSYSEKNCWAFDEEQVKEQVRNYLSQGLYYNANKQLLNLFNKVREMLKTRDSNAPRLLNLITYEFITDPRLVTSKSTSTPLSDKHRLLWDQLTNLWVCISMNPCMTDSDRKYNRKLLLKYSNHSNCPTEDSCHDGGQDEFEVTSTSDGGHSSVKRRRKYKLNKSVFHRAIECLDTVWGFGKRQRITTKDIPMECARVDALASHGFKAEAVEVALSVLSHMKQFMVSGLSLTQSTKEKFNNHELNYGLLGHPLDCHTPVYNTLINSDNTLQAYEFTLLALGESRLMPVGLYAQEKATRIEESIINRVGELQLSEEIKIKLVEICGLLLSSNSGLGHVVHPGIWPMHTFAKYLFMTLQSIDPELGFKVGLRAMRLSFLDEVDGVGNLFVRRVPRWYILGHVEVQQCNLASTMLNTYKYDNSKLEKIMECCSLHVHSSSHLFRLAQDCLRIGGEGGSAATAAPCLTGGAGCSSSYATNSNSNWGASSSSSGSSTRNIPPENIWTNRTIDWGASCGSGYVSTGWKSNGNSGLISVGFKLGLQVLRQTLKSVHRRRWDMVRWVVNCASDVGMDGILYILRNWAELFTPAEAVGSVATCIMGGSSGAGGNLSNSTTTEGGRGSSVRSSRMSGLQQDEIGICARALAIECARKDPPSCSLSALTLCETEPIAFETAYQIVVDASSTCMNSQQLFTIARYMEHRGYPLRSYKLALLAMESVHIGYNQDTHPAVSDIHWSTSLYYSLPHPPVNSQFIPLIIKNVQCANVLSEILRRSVASNDKSPQLNLLKESTMNAYISTVHSRLTHISPRHYTDFIEFLSKAKESFMLAGDTGQFSSLVESIKCSYKGKKKLVFLVTERFG